MQPSSSLNKDLHCYHLHKQICSAAFARYFFETNRMLKQVHSLLLHRGVCPRDPWGGRDRVQGSHGRHEVTRQAGQGPGVRRQRIILCKGSLFQISMIIFDHDWIFHFAKCLLNLTFFFFFRLLQLTRKFAKNSIVNLMGSLWLDDGIKSSRNFSAGCQKVATAFFT